MFVVYSTADFVTRDRYKRTLESLGCPFPFFGIQVRNKGPVTLEVDTRPGWDGRMKDFLTESNGRVFKRKVEALGGSPLFAHSFWHDSPHLFFRRTWLHISFPSLDAAVEFIAFWTDLLNQTNCGLTNFYNGL